MLSLVTERTPKPSPCPKAARRAGVSAAHKLTEPVVPRCAVPSAIPHRYRVVLGADIDKAEDPEADRHRRSIR
jgi:hypothetical protein